MKFWIRKGAFAAARKSFHHFGGFMEDQKALIAGGVGASIGMTLLELLRPWPIKLVVDHVISGDTSSLPGFLSSMTAETLLNFSALAMLLIPLSLGILNRLSQVALAQVGRKVTTRVRRHVCEHLQLLPLSFHYSARTGDLLVRVMGDVNMVRDILFSGWVSLIQRLLMFVGTFCLMVWISPFLGLLTLVPLPFLAWSVRSSGGRMKKAVSKQRRKEGNAAAMASELLTQIRGIKAFGAERRSAKLFAGLSRSGERAGVLATKIASMASLQAEVVTGAGLALILLVGANQVLSGDLKVGTLLVVISYARAVYKPLRKLSRDGVRLSKAAACAERLFEVLDLPAEYSDGGIKAPVFRGDIEFQQVSFSYNENNAAVEDLSFRIPAGALCVVTGKNGSGKSTSLSLLLRLFTPQRGAVRLDGDDIQTFELGSLRSRFAYVPQDNLLFAGTLRENILFGFPDASVKNVDDALAATGLNQVVAGLPEGLDTEIGESGDKLSGGQKRLVALARAAIRSAPILLLDEPLAGLDTDARLDVARAIRRIANGRTTIVVSHTSLDDVAPDQVIEMRGGAVVSIRERETT